MEIKVQCDCGQKYKFDAEPVDGRMPWEVNCPVCGLPGTEKANAIIQQQIASAAPVPPPAPTSTGASPKPRLVISRPQAPVAPAAQVAAPPPLTPRMVARPGVRSAVAARAEEEVDRNFWLSVAGVVGAAIVGMVLWHLGFRMTGWGLGFMALITGCAAGAAPQVVGHYRSVAMGLIAAFVTFVAIFGAQFLNAKVEIREFVEESASEEYEDAVKEAKAVVAAAPNGTDQELRSYLAKEYSFGSMTISPADIDAEDVEELKMELPFMRELAAGQVTQQQFPARQRELFDSSEYQVALNEAKSVVAAAPNGTEQELRVYLAKEYGSAGVTLNPAEIDSEEVMELQQQWPGMRDLAQGKLDQHAYVQQQRELVGEFSDEGFLKFYLIFRTLGIFNIINIVLGIGAAFLTAKG